MSVRKAVISGALICALVLGVTAVSAQWRGPRPVQPGGEMGNVLALVEEQIGLSIPELVAQLRSGATLAGLIEANGGDTSAVITAAVEAAAERIESAVAAGRITRERADALLAQVEAHVTAMINGMHRPLLGRTRFGHMYTERGRFGSAALGWAVGLRTDLIALAAEQTGLETSDIAARLAAGETLGDVLRASNVDINAFVDAAVAQAEANIKAQTDARLDALRQRLLTRLEARGSI